MSELHWPLKGCHYGLQVMFYVSLFLNEVFREILMMDNEDFLEFINVIEDNEDDIFRVQRMPKRYIRNEADPFEFHSNHEFNQRYWFSKKVVRDVILPLIHNEINYQNQKGLPVSPIQQVLIALRFYATASFQVCFSSIYHSIISSNIFSDCLCRFTRSLTAICIKNCEEGFPDTSK